MFKNFNSMKLYVIQRNSSNKIYLNLTANTRKELENKIGSYEFYLGDTLYNVSEVKAEVLQDNPIAGGIIGATIGSVFGPVGLILGSGLGMLFSSGSNNSETSNAEYFNKS